MPPKSARSTPLKASPVTRPYVKKKKPTNALITAYLILFNVASAVAWGTVLFKLLVHLGTDTSLRGVNKVLGSQGGWGEVVGRARTAAAECVPALFFVFCLFIEGAHTELTRLHPA